MNESRKSSWTQQTEWLRFMLMSVSWTGNPIVKHSLTIGLSVHETDINTNRSHSVGCILCSHMLRDVTYTFWSENHVQDCAVRPVAMAAGRRKVIRPVIMATGRRSKRSKVKGHVGTAIQHSYLGRNQAAPWPQRCAPRSGFAWSGPHPHAGLLIYRKGR